MEKWPTSSETTIIFLQSDAKKIELSYRIHLKFNLRDTHISWKGYLIGSLTPKMNIHLMTYKKKQTVPIRYCKILNVSRNIHILG
jgi:hypothetical protein